MSFYPENTMANFKTRLLSSINLIGDWEVGLSEIIYPNAWLSLSKDQRISVLFATDNPKPGEVRVAFMIGEEIQKAEPFSIEATIPRGSYATVSDIIDKINQSLDENTPPTCTNSDIPTFHVKFDYDGNTGRSSVSMSPMTIVYMSAELRRLLGFRGSK